MATRTPLIAGNWKLNLDHLEAVHQVQKLDFTLKDAKHDYEAVEVAVLAPFTDLRSIQTVVEADGLGIKYGSQDISQHISGAYTGEISPVFLKKLGVTYAAVGHSERRQYHGETDELVAAKSKAALDHGIVPIICVGEGLDIRKAGNHVEYTLAQVDGAFAGLTADEAAKTVVAYEPVWAIGTGEVATPADAQEVIGAIRGRLAELYSAEVADAVRVLYGGSVKSSSIVELMAEKDIDGGLVGGASLDADEFARIASFYKVA
ncbi:triose-phosphate isomerase [Rarobacter faecitabidus]|uniref:Triosephosphate isomerase n=1 Tax=Rarobacter faecitabidus TaxID=13243 RepID=A0A542ZW11_RARFA|nr:triose-phosphate isomerase [Rarobacter faecitabidus]TQL64499.1 triosephosphate isomerase [Rarobacter faecitabidus]